MVNTMTVPVMSRLPVNFSWPANGYALVGMPLMQGGLPGEVLSEGPGTNKEDEAREAGLIERVLIPTGASAPP